MAIGFIKTNSKYKKIDQSNIEDYIVDFEKFIGSFNIYEDIVCFFNNSSEELNRMFEGSPHYINVAIPEDVKWSIQEEKRLVNTALSEIKRTFAHCVKLINNRNGIVLDS